MRLRSKVLTLNTNFLVGLGLALAACGGSTFNGGVFRDGEIAFRVGPHPDTWRRIEVDETLLAFRDDQASALIAVNGRCRRDGDDVPLQALTKHLFLQFTNREVLEQRTIPLDGRAALRTVLLADLDGVPRRFFVYVLKKDDCVYDFLWIGRPEDAVENRLFQDFVRGFSTEI